MICKCVHVFQKGADADVVCELSRLCIEMCTKMISDCGRIPVFQVIQVSSFLHRLQQLLDIDGQVGALIYICITYQRAFTQSSPYFHKPVSCFSIILRIMSVKFRPLYLLHRSRIGFHVSYIPSTTMCVVPLKQD